MQNHLIDPTKIPGWGIDADPDNNPTYPMRNIAADTSHGMDWKRPPQQEDSVEVLQSIERNNRSAVFGTSTPPHGISGALRRHAFKYSESEWAHWLILMAADRVNVVEGVIEDFTEGRVPNVPGEMGVRSELAHNRTGLAKKIAVTTAVVGLAMFAANVMARRRAGTQRPQPRQLSAQDRTRQAL